MKWTMITLQLFVLLPLIAGVYSHGGGDDFADQREDEESRWVEDDMGYDPRDDMDYNPDWPRRFRGRRDFWGRILSTYCMRVTRGGIEDSQEEGENVMTALMEECQTLRHMEFRPSASLDLLQTIFKSAILTEELRAMTEEWEAMREY